MQEREGAKRHAHGYKEAFDYNHVEKIGDNRREKRVCSNR
jgi:hypothetical protein